MADDPFDRALRREQEIRERLVAGEIDDEEAAALRDLTEGSAQSGVQLTVEQAARVVEEEVDPALLVEFARAFPHIGIDDAIDVITSSDPDLGAIRAAVAEGLDDLSLEELEELWANDIEPSALRVARQLGYERPLEVVIELTSCVDDPIATLRELSEAGLADLDLEYVVELAGHGASPAALRTLLDAEPGIEICDAVALCCAGLDRESVRDFAAHGITIDSGRLASPFVGVGFSRASDGRRTVIGIGEQRITEDETVTGLQVGNLRIAAGVTVKLAATVIGDVTVDRDATLIVRGRVIGHIHNRGGTVIRAERASI